jgi:hypothetical protein
VDLMPFKPCLGCGGRPPDQAAAAPARSASPYRPPNGGNSH